MILKEKNRYNFKDFAKHGVTAPNLGQATWRLEQSRDMKTKNISFSSMLLLFKVVFRESVTFFYTDSDPDPAPDPALFVIDLQDANKKEFFALYFLQVHLHHSSKI
jgi:hypothetical protein